MNKLFKMLQESFGNPPQRNGFDLSRRDIFSTKVGIKVPCFALETVPNDYHEIRPINLIRTMPFNEANFVRMKQHMDFYFVPFTAFMTNFHEYIQQTTDPVNSLLVGQDVERTFPTFRLDALLLAIGLAHFYNETHSQTTIAGDIDDFDEGDSSGIFHRIYSECADILDLFLSPPTVNTGYLPVLDIFDNAIYRDAVRLLDMLGYGNYLNLINKTDFTSHPEDEPSVTVYDQFISYLRAICTNAHGRSINLFRLCAYQCIYQNFGINTTYDRLNVYSFNLDDITRYSADHGGDMIGAWSYRKDNNDQENPFWKVNCIFQIRYSQWKKDIFTAAYPDSQFGGVSVVSTINISSNATNVSKQTLQIAGGNVPKDLVWTTASGTTSPANLVGNFNILDLRRAEALQGWKEDMMRSGFRAKQRQKSQFGVSPSYDPHCMPYVLGSVSSDIQKDTVTGTSGEQFAELAATGMSTMGNDVIRFDGSGRNDFGIIIGILSIIPEADYDSFGLDLHNIKVEPFDFYTPAFQNIGLQALTSKYLDAQFAAGGSVLDGYFPDILGYVPRYSEYKQAIDKVHGEFCVFRDFWNWADAHSNPYRAGMFRSYVSTRYDMERHGLTTLASLYVNPGIVDDIFKVVVDGDNRQATDQFMVNAFFDVKSVRPMSVLGLPRW